MSHHGLRLEEIQSGREKIVFIPPEFSHCFLGHREQTIINSSQLFGTCPQMRFDACSDAKLYQ